MKTSTSSSISSKELIEIKHSAVSNITFVTGSTPESFSGNFLPEGLPEAYRKPSGKKKLPEHVPVAFSTNRCPPCGAKREAKRGSRPS